jgi:hypothetical protein
MNNLNKDLILIFFNYLKWNDVLSIRSINKYYKDIYSLWFWNKSYNDVCPSSTMISVKKCDICDKIFPDYLNQFQLYWYNMPRPVYIYCNNVNCIHNIYRLVFKEVKEKNYEIVINEFLKLNDEKKIQIPRSTNEITFARVNQNFLIKNNLGYNLYVQWDDYYKTVNINNEIIKKSIINKPLIINL